MESSCCGSECFSRLKRKIKRVNISRRLVKAYIALFLAMVSSALGFTPSKHVRVYLLINDFSFIQFSSSYSITMLFPFAPFLVKFLLPHVEETDVGT